MGKPTFDICKFKTPELRGWRLMDRTGFKEIQGGEMFSPFWIYRYQMKVFVPEYIGLRKRTRGTETSKYPEERTSTRLR